LKQKKPEPVDEAALERAALAYLNRFDSTVSNLKSVLLERVRRSDADAPRRAELERHISALLERYQSSRLLDDERFAKNVAEGLRARGASHRAIERKLRAKGVDASVLDAVLGAESNAKAELDAARRYVTRRLKSRPNDASDRRGRARLLAALARQGYGYDVARAAIGGPAADEEEF
jgi:regulatory protein